MSRNSRAESSYKMKLANKTRRHSIRHKKKRTTPYNLTKPKRKQSNIKNLTSKTPPYTRKRYNLTRNPQASKRKKRTRLEEI